jgi:hypothetical protein
MTLNGRQRYDLVQLQAIPKHADNIYCTKGGHNQVLYTMACAAGAAGAAAAEVALITSGWIVKNFARVCLVL